MKILKKLICLCGGHKWKEVFKGHTNYIKFSQCTRCGKKRNGFRQSAISNCVAGRIKTHKGYIWKLKDNIQ